ncbi:hypothetical protein BH10PSE1_BH10PSE1_18260 [soil metagenome]
MTQFEFFMTFYSLLLGLAVAELLLGFGCLLRARSQPRWGLFTPLLGVILFIHIMASFSDAWVKLQGVNIDLVSFGPPALIGVAYFVGAILCVPRDIDDWPSLDEYFHARKRFTLGALLSADVLTIVCLELPSVVGQRPSAVIAYALINTIWMALTAAPLLTRSRRVAVGSLVGLLILMVVLYATPLRIGGLIEALFGL